MTNKIDNGRVDDEYQYGTFLRSIRRHERLQDLVLRKAFNVPMAEGINAPRINIGPGLLKVALLSLAMLGAGAGGVVGLNALRQDSAPVLPLQAPVGESQEYRVSFWAEDGTQIDVQPVQEGNLP